MAELFDDISRMVGGPMPRRQVIRLAASALTWGALSTLWPARVSARRQACGTESFMRVAQATKSAENCEKAYNQACAAAKADCLSQAKDICRNSPCPVPKEQNGAHCEGVTGPVTGNTCNAKVSYTGWYLCTCTALRACSDNTVCCPPTQVCCGGRTCCPAANCNPNGVCVGGNPG